MGALASAGLMLFLRTGLDNLVWAFLVGFVGAAALGVWAMANANRPWWAALLLTTALWTHGDGPFYLAPTAVLLGRRWWVVAVPIATCLGWYVVAGHHALRGHPAAGPLAGLWPSREWCSR